ncbi:polysaccharide deacetylase family protein [Mesobaculum littorinae]|uniref:polysaccharide deacetylase family protein n=1 Tax=Mesobaculum littorinae TaxID=2486419 RepID=UPI0013E326A3|nr:polysaccharide deacetylase family protein [Mesobaculum littorinae]
MPPPHDDAAPRRRDRHRRVAQWGAVVLGLSAATGIAAVTLGLPGGAGTPAGAALGAAVGAVLGALLMHRQMILPRGLPVLTYHSVSEDAAWLPWARDTSIRPATLDRHLRLFARMGLRVVDTETLTRDRLAGRPLPRNAVALHFDDGYLDTWVAAAPILAGHGACATVFVSTDFIAPDRPLAPRMGDSAHLRWDGYMSWRELRQLEAQGLKVEAHGTDHGRVETGPEVRARVTGADRARHAPLLWSCAPGPKHDWHLTERWLPAEGAVLRPSAPALAARRWRFVGIETDAAYRARLARTFQTVDRVFRTHLGRPPRLFCWPENRATPEGRTAAQNAGYLATTAGAGRNTASEDPRVIARLHAGQDYAGVRCGPLDDLALRAHIRCFQGNLYWALPLCAIAAIRRVARLLRRPAASAGTGMGRTPDTCARTVVRTAAGSAPVSGPVSAPSPERAAS